MEKELSFGSPEMDAKILVCNAVLILKKLWELTICMISYIT